MYIYWILKIAIKNKHSENDKKVFIYVIKYLNKSKYIMKEITQRVPKEAKLPTSSPIRKLVSTE